MLSDQKQHNTLAAGRWGTLPLRVQLGNVGSDFERAVRWKEKNQTNLFINAATRTLELLDLTLADTRWHNHRLKELARLREEVCKELFAEQIDRTSADQLQKYFFAMARASGSAL